MSGDPEPIDLRFARVSRPVLKDPAVVHGELVGRIEGGTDEVGVRPYTGYPADA